MWQSQSPAFQQWACICVIDCVCLLCLLRVVSCSNDQISTIVGLRAKGVAKRVAEKKMRLELRDSAIE